MMEFPAEDYVDMQYDEEFFTETTDILIVFSTQRSGSTLLCNLLQKNFSFVTHEYFHPYAYMPVLAQRWGCVNDAGILNSESYSNCLMKFRTGKSGWLGINLHGSHIDNYMKFERHFDQLRKHFVYLVRRDLVTQAVSYEIASQTDSWSSFYKAKEEPVYNYESILDRISEIQSQNILIQTYLKMKGEFFTTIYYEDLLRSPSKYLALLPCASEDTKISCNFGLKRQSTSINKKWVNQFSSDHLYRQRECKIGFVDRVKFKLSNNISRNHADIITVK